VTFVGKMRVHFNRHGAEPLVWCVVPVDDSGAPRVEIAVRSVHVTAPLETVYTPKATADDDDGRPSAWLLVCGELTITSDGRALIR
jgi:hypothetical protein